jgi:hypothetical protein
MICQTTLLDNKLCLGFLLRASFEVLDLYLTGFLFRGLNDRKSYLRNTRRNEPDVGRTESAKTRHGVKELAEISTRLAISHFITSLLPSAF